MSKPAKTYKEQLDLLKARGLVVPDESFALHVLEHHNYYRLSAYRFSFTLPKRPDCFLPGTTFTQLWALYEFDRNVRQLVMEACKRVEISARSRWAYEVGHQLGPLAYLENRHFANPLIHAKTLTKLDSEMSRSKEDFIKHHRIVLGMPWPPVWVVAEVASFGNTSTMIGQLKEPALRQSIADGYQLDEKTFCSLLHHLCVLRNTAAHHARLWNRKFVVTFQLPKKKPMHLWANFFTPLGLGNANRIYNSLVLLIHLLQCIDPATPWPARLSSVINTLDVALLPEMGFPLDWKARPLWKELAVSRLN
jgi:abortive infection bacteriophage resistance protein